jgi:hypothetical protein
MNLAAIIETARLADMMRTADFTAVRAFAGLGGLQCVVRAAHVAHGLAGFSFWNRHGYYLSYSKMRLLISEIAP